jgi:predicted TIM-barrel fold metal-dependent hydrolase
MPVPRVAIDSSGGAADEQRISADSHMAEPLDLWETRLPDRFKDRALRFPELKLFETNHHLRAGGWDPDERLKDMAFDGISAEVLYPTLAKQAWNLGDPALEEACVRVYNDWLVEFCSADLERLWGLCMLSFYDIPGAVAELEQSKKAGLRGAYLPIGPDTEIPYSSDHYEALWAAAQEMDMPLSLHINSGLGYARKPRGRSGVLPDGVHKFDSMKAIGDIVGSGVLERYPELKIVVAEAGVGWIPFFAQEFDAYVTQRRSKLPQRPSEYIWRQVYGAFISDKVGGFLLSQYGQDNFMWSNDYPHPACIWPGAGNAIAQDLGHLTPEAREKVIRLNAAKVYNGGKLPPPADPPGEHQALDELWFEEHVAVFV